MPTAIQAELDKVLEEQYRRKLQANFSLFVRQAWEVLNPGEPLVENFYIDAIAEHLQALRQGQFTRLIINQPPRTLKSTITSIMFPDWLWTSQPSTKLVFYTYSFDKLSVPQSVQRRRLLMSNWYQTYWGDRFHLSFDENMKWRFSCDAGGHMTVVTGATGTGGNYLIVDDPHSVEEALSDAERQAGVTKFREGLMSRLDNPQSDKVVLVMQRLHDSDVAGEMLKDGGWTHLCLPAEAEKRTKIFMPLSKTTWTRKKSNLLDATRLPQSILKSKKVELGSRAYAGQYQQEPAPPTGNIFNTTWWQWYDALPELEQVVVSVDAAFKDTKTSNDVSIQKWGMLGVRSFFISRDTAKMGFAATKAHIHAMMESDPKANVLLVEEKANGAAIIEALKMEFHVIAIDPGHSDKVARAEACSPMVEAGTVYLPRKNPDGVKIQTLAAKFPNADKDDIDALTQFLNWRRKRGAAMKWFEEQAKKMQQEAEPEPEKLTTQRHPTAQEVQRLAMEEAGLKVNKSRMSKQAKAADLKKVEAEQPKTAPVPPGSCPDCGSPNLFRSSQGRKCLQCGKVIPLPGREVNIG